MVKIWGLFLGWRWKGGLVLFLIWVVGLWVKNVVGLIMYVCCFLLYVYDENINMVKLYFKYCVCMYYLIIIYFWIMYKLLKN